jgi:hypothetical protein
MLNFLLMLILACESTPADSSADAIAEREDPVIEDSLPEDEPWGYEPDMVLFHNVTIITSENEISCYDDGDATPYCGVYKIILPVWEEWEGLTDEGACTITHRVSPEYLVEGGGSDLVNHSATAAWEMDATQSLVSTSAMCDFIREGATGYGVLERFKTENLVWGFTTPSEAMLEEYRDLNDFSSEDWETTLPKLGAFTNQIGTEVRVPNFSVRYEIDENNSPVAGEDLGYNAVSFPESTLENGYYRSPPFYVYSIDRFTP